MFACILCSGKFSTARKLRRHFRYDHKILQYDGLAVSVDTQMEVEDFMEPPPISINFAVETADSPADSAMPNISRESCKYSPRTVSTQTERAWRTPPLDFAQTRPCKPGARKTRSLRSFSSLSLRIPTRKTKIAKSKSFSSVASSVWNKLPGHFSSISTLPAFRKKLKYHLFRSAFPGNPSPSTGITFCDVSPSTDATQVGHTPPPG